MTKEEKRRQLIELGMSCAAIGAEAFGAFLDGVLEETANIERAAIVAYLRASADRLWKDDSIARACALVEHADEIEPEKA